MLEKEKREWERQLLCCIEHFGQGQKGLSRKLLSLLKEANYYENLRVLLAIGRLQDKYAAPLLCRYILQKKEAVCQIFALDQINQLPLTVNEKKETAILLLTSLPQPKHLSPLTLRAFLWFLATECGDDCLPDLLQMCIRDRYWAHCARLGTKTYCAYAKKSGWHYFKGSNFLSNVKGLGCRSAKNAGYAGSCFGLAANGRE